MNEAVRTTAGGAVGVGYTSGAAGPLSTSGPVARSRSSGPYSTPAAPIPPNTASRNSQLIARRKPPRFGACVLAGSGIMALNISGVSAVAVVVVAGRGTAGVTLGRTGTT